MSNRSRPMLTVRGIDPEMSKTIKPLSLPQASRKPEIEKAREEKGGTLGAVDVPDSPAMRKVAMPKQERRSAVTAPFDDDVTIWLALHPLQRHADRLNALRAQGVDMVIILRLAWQSFSENLTLAPQYVKPAPCVWWRAHMQRKRVKVNAALLADISGDARDFGALKPSELVAGQIQLQWIAAMDQVIAKVESEV